MTVSHRQLIKSQILSEATFVSAVFSGRQKGQTLTWEKATLRPALVKNKRQLQISYFDGKKDLSKNYGPAESETKIDDLLTLPFKNINLQTTAENIRVQMTKKGKIIIHRDKTPAAQPDLRHDRRKKLIIPSNKPDPFLQIIGIMTADGKIKAKMQDKFWQINRFLQLISQTKGLTEPDNAPLRVIDCGCGSAYLTFAVYHYLNNILKRPTQMIGIDLKQDLLQKRAEQAQSLGWERLTFEAGSIIDYQPIAAPDIVLALHACDTATDEALAQAIKWGSRYIFSAPCCHHHLQAQLPTVGQSANLTHKALLRHGILKERLGDILTDSFRALILRILGYRADVLEFVESEHTAKNLMIRAVKRDDTGQDQFMQEYKALKNEWQVTPYLETLLTVPGSGFRVQSSKFKQLNSELKTQNSKPNTRQTND